MAYERQDRTLQRILLIMRIYGTIFYKEEAM